MPAERAQAQARHDESADHAAADVSAGACSCTSVCAIAENGELEEAGDEEQRERERIAAAGAKPAIATAPEHREHESSPRARLQQTAAFEHDSRR